MVETDIESAPTTFGFTVERFIDQRQRARRQLRIGVEKQKHIASGTDRTGIHLYRSPLICAQAKHRTGFQVSEALPGAVRAATVDDDGFEGFQFEKVRNQLRNNLRFVIDWNDD